MAASLSRQLCKRGELRYPNSTLRCWWVREFAALDAQHYHFALFMDGRYIQHPHHLQEEIQAICIELEGAPHCLATLESIDTEKTTARPFSKRPITDPT